MEKVTEDLDPRVESRQERAGGLDSWHWKEFRLRILGLTKDVVFPCTLPSQGGEGTLSSWTEGGKDRSEMPASW